MHYTLNDFDYTLPSALIAQEPCLERSAARLLEAQSKQVQHRFMRDLPLLLRPNDLLVFNDSQVIKARLYGNKDSRGKVEVLVEKLLPNSFEVWAHIRASKAPREGSILTLGNQELGFAAKVLGRCGPGNSLYHLLWPSDPHLLMQQFGHVPLPPYITHGDTEQDKERYQTVFAKIPGSVAAPTAALHFDNDLFLRLRHNGIEQAYVTLHVGAGTFQPVRTQNLNEHLMHSEWYEIPQATQAAIEATKRHGGQVIAVGTTTLRALESAAIKGNLQVGPQTTSLFITPGFSFRIVDGLLTNFHLPKSTLLMLVSAFAGYEKIKALYALAIEHRYRFFSYGDAMLLKRWDLASQ